MIIALWFVAASIVFGIGLVSYLNAYSEKGGLVMLGTLGGLTTAITLTYILQLLFPFSPALLLIESILFTASGIILLYLKGWNILRQSTLDKWTLLVFGICLVLFSIIAPKLLIKNEEGLSTGIVNAYGDVAWHTANIMTFVEGQSVPPENPIFADTKLTYPFLVNFFSATLFQGGLSLPAAMNLPAILLIPTLLTFLYIFVRDYTGSSRAALIATLLFLFGGATLGWTRIGHDFLSSNQQLGQFLLHLPTQDYSGVGTDSEGFHFLNPITSLLLPQRAFLFGIPLALSVLILLRPRSDERLVHSVVAGALAGMLPLFHGHTTIALAAALVGIFTLNPSSKWVVFGLTASIIGIPEMLYYSGVDSSPGAFFRFEPRWLAGEHNILWYWLKNTGLLIPTVLGGLLWRKPPLVLKALAGSGLFLFLLANTFAFAPWIWDNFKLLVFFFIFTLPLVGWIAATLWNRMPRWGVSILLLILLGHTLSAALDIWKLTLPTATIWQEWDTNAAAAATHITAQTKPGDSILTAPTHNSAAVLAGRPRYLGYAAHVWSHGYSPWNREKAIKLFYEGTLQALPESQPQYVLVGPQEKSMYTIVVRPEWQLVFSGSGYSLYRISTF